MASTAIGMVQTAPNTLEAREFALPTIGPDDGLLRVQRCGLCGTDVEQVHGELSFVPNLVIPGHEPVGIIEEVGKNAAERWGVQPGDRVIVEASIPCRQCSECAEGRFNTCPNQLSLGFVPISLEPSLYGGFAEYMYLPPNVTLHKISHDVPMDIAPFYNALSCGVEWVPDAGGVTLGSTVVILGSGQRGIACAIVAKAVGAEQVIMTGLAKDANKLAIARELGVDATIDIEHEDLRTRVAELTDSEGPDVVIDVVPSVASTVTDAVDIIKQRGTVVIAGVKGDKPVPGLLTDKIMMKALTVKGVRGKRSRSIDVAIQILESKRFPLERLQPTTYRLQDAIHAIEDLSGQGAGSLVVSLAPGE